MGLQLSPGLSAILSSSALAPLILFLPSAGVGTRASVVLSVSPPSAVLLAPHRFPAFYLPSSFLLFVSCVFLEQTFVFPVLLSPARLSPENTAVALSTDSRLRVQPLGTVPMSLSCLCCPFPVL